MSTSTGLVPGLFPPPHKNLYIKLASQSAHIPGVYDLFDSALCCSCALSKVSQDSSWGQLVLTLRVSNAFGFFGTPR